MLNTVTYYHKTFAFTIITGKYGHTLFPWMHKKGWQQKLHSSVASPPVSPSLMK